MSFEGETCPYVQYTVARCNSVLNKFGQPTACESVELNEQEYAVVSVLGKFKDVVKTSAEKYEPSFITRYALELSSAFNKFYFDCKIGVDDENTRNLRLNITKAVKITLTNALTLLGIETVEQM